MTARGIGRVKNVTSAATRLTARCFRETMSQNGDYNRSVNLGVTRPPSSVRENVVYQYGSCEDNYELRFAWYASILPVLMIQDHGRSRPGMRHRVTRAAWWDL